MPAGPRHLLEERFSKLSTDLEALFEDSREQTRRSFAEQLNQSVRRLRQAVDADELCAILADAASPFATGLLFFRVNDGIARCPKIEVPLAEAAAFAAAVEIHDPLVALASPAEVSAPLVELLGLETTARAHLFPVGVRDCAPALIYAWGSVQGPAIELLTQMASAVWSAYPEPKPEPEPAPLPELVTIAPASAAAAAPALALATERKPSSWDDLPPEDQQVHLRAQRFARVQVAEMRLQHAEAVQSGRARRNLYEVLRTEIDAARAAFRGQFFTCASMVDYLDLELTRTLAHENPELLGRTYPGPLV
jgi:hypothetical protein